MLLYFTPILRKSLSHFIVLSLLIIAKSSPTQSSDLTGTLTGEVTDPAGAGLLGAKISAVHKSIRQSFEALADGQGRYTINNLATGTYVVEVSAASFATVTKEVRIDPNVRTSVNFQLPLLSTTASVTVTDSAKAELEMVPGSTAVITPLEIEQSRAYILKDVLNFTPGVFANPRYGSDETQFSIRGSGLRSNYHERGVNLFINGMPYQDADGFSDFETLELMSTQRVEVWKGANALRLGANTMGGAVNFVTDTGQTASPLQVQLLGGSYGLFKGQASTGGVKGRFDYFLSVSDTELEGYRDHSQQGRQRLYGIFGIRLNEKTKLRFDVIYANIAENLPAHLLWRNSSPIPARPMRRMSFTTGVVSLILRALELGSLINLIATTRSSFSLTDSIGIWTTRSLKSWIRMHVTSVASFTIGSLAICGGSPIGLWLASLRSLET